MNKFLVIGMVILFPNWLHAQNLKTTSEPKRSAGILSSSDSLVLLNDSNPDQLLKKGQLLEKEYQYLQALQLFEKAYQKDSDNLQLLSEMAETNNNLGNFKKALPYYLAIYRKDSINSVTAIKVAKAYFNLRKYQEPFEILSKVYQGDSSNLYLAKQLAFAATRSGHDSLGIVLYERILPMNPNDLNNYINLASLYQRHDGYLNAVKTYQSGIAQFPDEPLLLSKLGDLHYAKRNFGDAILPYEKLLSFGDSIPEVVKSLGIAYYYTKEYKKSLSLLDKSLLWKPNDPVAGMFMGLCYKNLNQPEESIAHLNFASKIAIPYYLSDIYNQLGNVYADQKAFKKAVSSLKKAYLLDSTKTDVLFKIANTYDVWQKDKSQAFRYYDRFLTIKKEESDYLKQLTKYAEERKKKINPNPR